MKNIHKGETCLIIGNGPSLKDIPVKFLKKYPTFGTNRIYLKEGFTPTYYVAVNKLIIEQSMTEIGEMDTTKFIRAGLAKHFPGSYPIKDTKKLEFSKEPLVGLYEGFTVTYACLQLAFWMGFKTVLLIGIDHRYSYEGGANELKPINTFKGNHFDENYFGQGEVVNNPDMLRSKESYTLALAQFKRSRRKVINITPNTALDVFPVESWKEYA